jgi:hypothetical protein
MSLKEARQHTVQRDIQHQLRLFMAPEAIEILARATASIMARDPSQSRHFAQLFGSALDREFAFLTSRHSAQSAHGEERRGAS